MTSTAGVPYTSSSPGGTERLEDLPSLFQVLAVLYGGEGTSRARKSIPSVSDVRGVVERCYEQDAVFENPLFTFSTRASILDAFLLSRWISSVRLPRLPSLPILHSSRRRRPGLQVASVWSEMGDLAESDSFDGYHLGVLDHVVHISIFPSIFSRPIISLRMLSILQMNESNKIHFHRDHFDARDLVESVIPLAAFWGLLFRWLFGHFLRMLGSSLGAFEDDPADRTGGRGPFSSAFKDELEALRNGGAALSAGRTDLEGSFHFHSSSSPPHRSATTSTSASSLRTSPQHKAMSPFSSPVNPTVAMPPSSVLSSSSHNRRSRRHTYSKSWGSSSIASLARAEDGENDEVRHHGRDEEIRRSSETGHVGPGGEAVTFSVGRSRQESIDSRSSVGAEPYETGPNALGLTSGWGSASAPDVDGGEEDAWRS